MKGRGHERRGFTLVELLTALAVTSAMLLLLAGLMRESGRGYRRVRDGVAGRVEARAALDLIARDASTVVPGLPVTVVDGREGAGWDFAGGGFEKWEPEEPAAETGTAGRWRSDELGFYLSLGRDAQPEGERNRGDICHVRYHTAVTPDDPLRPEGRRSRKLYRVLTPSGATHEARRDGRRPGRGAAGAGAEAVAFNVARFEVGVMVTTRRKTGDGGWRRELARWNPARFTEYERGAEEAATGGGAGTLSPTAVVVDLWLAPERAAGLPARQGLAAGAPDAKLLRDEDLEHYSMRIPLVDL